MEKSVGQVIAERDSGKELPFMVIFFGGAFLPGCEQTHHETEGEARAHAESVLSQLRNRPLALRVMKSLAAIIHGPGLPEHGLRIG